jgi:hypothetical protein
MQPKNPRVAVFFASVLAVVVIAAAGVTRYAKIPEIKLGGGAPVVAVDSDKPPTNTDAGPANWQKALAETSNATGQSGVSVTDALMGGLNANYASLTDSTTPAGTKKAILNDIVKSALPKKEPAHAFTLNELSVSTSTDVGTYRIFLALVLQQSSEVRENELATFSRAIRNKNNSGSPELIEDATIYQRIQSQLVAIAVPSSVAREHLAVVNSLGVLAEIVALMGVWNGDAALGLVYIGEFKDAEATMEDSVYALAEKINNLESS